MNASTHLRLVSEVVRSHPPLRSSGANGIIKCGETPDWPRQRAGATPRHPGQRPYVRFLANALHNRDSNRRAVSNDRPGIQLLQKSTPHYKSFNRHSGIIDGSAWASIVNTPSDSFALICPLHVRFPDSAFRRLPGRARAPRPHRWQACPRKRPSRSPRRSGMPDWE